MMAGPLEYESGGHTDIKDKKKRAQRFLQSQLSFSFFFFTHGH